LGFGEFRFRESEAALMYVHLVALACILLDVLRCRLLRYCVVKSFAFIEATVEWVRRKAMRLFMHIIRNINLSNKSLLRLIDTK
jgi:hypothetical protein